MPIHKKNRLLALERTLTGRRSRSNNARKMHGKIRHVAMATQHKHGARINAQTLDQGEPIEVTYNDTTDSYEAVEMAYQPAEEDAETLEWNEDETEAQAFDWDEDEDAEAFQVEAFEEDEDEDSDGPNEDYDSESKAFSAIDFDDSELAEEFDFTNLDAAQDDDEPSQAMNETDFAADLQAIINGDKTYDRDRGGMVNTSDDEDELATAKSEAPAEQTPPGSETDTNPPAEADANPHDVFSQMSQHMPHNRMGSSAQLAQAKNQPTEEDERPHDVFDRMGRNMSYANAFDLGSISMEQRFEEFDDAIDKEEQKIQARAKTTQKNNEANDQEISAPLAINDAALVDDLDQMHEAMAHEEDNESDLDSELDEDGSGQTMQLAIDGVAYVTKTDKGGAYLHAITANPAGEITNVKSVKDRIRVPTGTQLLIDSGKTKDDYIWAQHNNSTGAIRKNSIVMFGTAAKPASVLVSDVVVTDQGIQEKQTAPFYKINTTVDGGGRLTQFIQMDEQNKLPLGTKMLVHPGIHSTDSDSIIWGMHVSGADSKTGAVDMTNVIIPSQAQYPPVAQPEDFKGFFLACWSTPWLKALYRGFLRTRYAGESLDFLSAVPQIRNAAQAKVVLAHFVGKSAMQRVNISSSVEKALVTAITNPPQDHADWRIPFGYDEQSGTTLREHITGSSAFSEIRKLLMKDFYGNKPKFSDQNERTKYINELKK